MIQHDKRFQGLSPAEVQVQRSLHGSNHAIEGKNLLLELIKEVVLQPMFILLLAACTVYFFSSAFAEAFTMLAALLFVAGIDIFQSFRSQKAVKALSKVNQTKASVIRSGEVSEKPAEEIVVKDILVCEEGTIIPADALLLASNDFAVNEAVLTGESVSLEKSQGDKILQGTLVVRGYCYASVVAVGSQTALAGIGQLVKTAGVMKTPLQIKVAAFVRAMVMFGSIAFLFVWAYYFWQTRSLLSGLLHGLAMAMSVLPEEIPVALSSFMALGAYRLYKKGLIARSPQTVETLGAATVLCVDKTGTITQNLMQLAYGFEADTGEEVNFKETAKTSSLLEYAMWSSEEAPFDPMEISIHNTYSKSFRTDERKVYRMLKEYPLSGTPPAMTHIFSNGTENFKIACKGALEGVLNLCKPSEKDKAGWLQKGQEYASKGYRVLGIAKGSLQGKSLPETQNEIDFHFLGIIAFLDPPVEGIRQTIEQVYNAGLELVMITGDYKETAVSVADQAGFRQGNVMTGEELKNFSTEELRSAVKGTNIFARISPEQKLRIIEALQQNAEIVAMTGDGVNDAPALKAAHISIAMGRRGTEVAKGAAGLILVDDDLSKINDAILIGRRININLRKAFSYIISIHIPIILLVTAPIFLNWLPTMLLTPVHVIFLELIMGPTCSIVYEREQAGKEELSKPSDSKSLSLFSFNQLKISILQGLLITIGCIVAGYLSFTAGGDEAGIRTYIFSTLLISNIFLTLLNRSFTESLINTLKIKNNLIPVVVFTSLLLLLLVIYLPPIQEIFKLEALKVPDLLISFTTALVFTFWVEIYKYFKRKNATIRNHSSKSSILT